jgi:hypothetical protein
VNQSSHICAESLSPYCEIALDKDVLYDVPSPFLIPLFSTISSLSFILFHFRSIFHLLLTSLVLPFPLPSFFLVFSLTHSLCLSVSLSLSLLDGDVTRAPSIDLSRPGTSGVSSEGAPRSADVEEVQEKNIFLKGIRSMKNDDSDIHQRKIQISINKIVNF